MRLETIKSLLLAGLVALSLLLSAFNWFGWGSTGQYYTPLSQDLLLSGSESMAELAKLGSPSRIVVHLGGGRHQLFYPDDSHYQELWSSVFGLISAAGSGLAKSWSLVDSSAAQNVRLEASIELLLAPGLNVQDWLGLWGYELPSNQRGSASMEGLDRVLIALKPPRMLIEEPKGKFISFKLDESRAAATLNNLSQMLGSLEQQNLSPAVELDRKIAGFSVLNGVFVPLRAPYLVPLKVKIERLDPIQMSQRWFSNPASVIRVKDVDGTLLFTDGRATMKWDALSGAFYLEQKTSGAANVDLARGVAASAQFISFFGGLPENIYLRSYSRSDEGWQFEFSYRYIGMPVLLQQPAVSVGLKGLLLRSYSRRVLIPVEPYRLQKPMLGFIWILDVLNEPSIQNRINNKGGLEDMFLAYYEAADGQELKLRPAWVIRLADGTLIFVDAYTGAEINGLGEG